MALFDNINSRYTQSMAEGGTYQRDAAEGGYDRKELKGLSKQARRGSLTQRERARYKYLKDERGGRRKRGLLAGLGGAAALAGGLAAAGKLGGGSGGGGLMDSIKARFAEKQEDRAGELGEQGDGRMEGLETIGADDVSTDEPVGERGLMESANGVMQSVSSNMQEPSNMELYDEYGRSFDGMEGEQRARNKASQVVKGANPLDMYYGWDGEKETRGLIGKDEITLGGSRENDTDQDRLIGNNEFYKDYSLGDVMTDEEQTRRNISAFDAEDKEGRFRPMGYEAEGIPADGRPLTEAEALRSRMARRPGQPYDRSGVYDPEYGGNMEEGKMETLPGADGEEPTQSGGATVRQLLSSLEGSDLAKGLKNRLTSPNSNVQQRMDAFMKRTGGFKPGANGMRVGTAKQEKIDRLRKFMKNRYR